MPFALVGAAWAAEAAEAFRAFVAELAVKGAHPEGRILVDYGNQARLYRCGDVVDARLGIRLHAFTVEGRTAVLIFQDGTGAQVSRKVGIHWRP